MFEFLLGKTFKNRRIKFYNSDYIEPQEVFLDSLARKKEEQLGLSEKKIEVPLSMSVMKIFFSFFICQKHFRCRYCNTRSIRL